MAGIIVGRLAVSMILFSTLRRSHRLHCSTWRYDGLNSRPSWLRALLSLPLERHCQVQYYLLTGRVQAVPDLKQLRALLRDRDRLNHGLVFQQRRWSGSTERDGHAFGSKLFWRVSCHLRYNPVPMKSKSYRLVLIEWVDSVGCSGRWDFLADKKATTALVCRSVGWLIQDGKKRKTVVPHVTALDDPEIDPQGQGDMTIPTMAILSITDLPIPKKKTKRR